MFVLQNLTNQHKDDLVHLFIDKWISLTNNLMCKMNTDTNKSKAGHIQIKLKLNCRKQNNVSPEKKLSALFFIAFPFKSSASPLLLYTNATTPPLYANDP